MIELVNSTPRLNAQFNPTEIFGEDYFERGLDLGISCYHSYRWQPARHRALGKAVYEICKNWSNGPLRIVDYGCAHGFLIKALRQLGVSAWGCDVSQYAIHKSAASRWCRHCEGNGRLPFKGFFSHCICKDVLEHIEPEKLGEVLVNLTNSTRWLIAIIPLGDNGYYRIKEYHQDITHVIAEDENWWCDTLESHGWIVRMLYHRHSGIKDNWSHCPKGNAIIVAERNEVSK